MLGPSSSRDPALPSRAILTFWPRLLTKNMAWAVVHSQLGSVFDTHGHDATEKHENTWALLPPGAILVAEVCAAAYAMQN